MKPSTCPLCGLHRRHSGLCPSCGDPDALVTRWERDRHLDRDFLASRVQRSAPDLWERETESDAYRGRAERQIVILIACAWAVVGMMVGWVALRMFTGVWVP